MDGKEHWQERGVGPGLTTSGDWLSSPNTRHHEALFLWSQRSCDASGLLDRATTGDSSLRCASWPHPFCLIQKAKERRALNETRDTQGRVSADSNPLPWPLLSTP